MSLEERLRRGLDDLGLDLTAGMRGCLIDYLKLLQKWNQVYNLTAVRDPSEMVDQHLLDSLAALPYLAVDTVLDVGSGAGLPGIPAAIALPKTRVTLLDANQKKASFMRQAVIELGLANATVVCERVESWRAEPRFDVVISRAFSSAADFIARAGRLCAPGGVLVAMKGTYPREELERLPAGYAVSSVVKLRVPGVHGERHLVLIEAA